MLIGDSPKKHQPESQRMIDFFLLLVLLLLVFATLSILRDITLY